MKILVVFGSASDENIALPLVEALTKECEVEYQVISAHRDLEKLHDKIRTWRGDAIIAGAGLAAALPGVVAAMTDLPVFGVPVPSQFGGLDSLCSIAQMPPGVPVISCGPGKTGEIVAFLRRWKAWNGSRHVHFVVPQGVSASDDIAKTEAVAREKGLRVSSSGEKDAAAFNVYFVRGPEDIRKDEFCLHIPFFGKNDLARPESYLSVLDWTGQGGLWLGANNTRNAVQSVLRLSGKHDTALPDILYRGSVKNVRGMEGKSPYIFEYSDRYSIYDWGEMPDGLRHKGESLAFLAWFFFDYLNKSGLKHHMLGLADDGLKPLGKGKIAPTKFLLVQPVKVLKPQSRVSDGKLMWDYAAYQSRPVNALVPLEVIFRFGVPEGSSLLKRTTSPDYCKSLGLAHAPQTGDRFEKPVIELSTKLENKDRYISPEEACAIAGLSQPEFKKLQELTAAAALTLKECFSGIGVELWDGKFEFAFIEGKDGVRDFMLVDSIGPDELRLTAGDVHLSKEMLRAHYKGSNWLSALEKAKALADERGEKDWKKICTGELHAAPATLPPQVREKAEMIYMSLCRALCEKYHGTSIFSEAWDIAEVVSALKQLPGKAAA